VRKLLIVSSSIAATDATFVNIFRFLVFVFVFAAATTAWLPSPPRTPRTTSTGSGGSGIATTAAAAAYLS